MSVRSIIQVDNIDTTLKNRLWNNICEDLFAKFPNTSVRNDVFKDLWKNFFLEPMQDLPIYNNQSYHFINYVKDWYFAINWNEIYDFIEFLLLYESIAENVFSGKCNKSLQSEMSGYRIIGKKIVPIITDIEIETIESAIQSQDKFKMVNRHLNTALSFLSDRKSPDYRNSIKESISAVEALCKLIARDEKTKFGTAMAIIEKQYNLHPSLKEAYNKIYGYTSDADGIRHAMLEDGLPIEFEDAKFMLVSCSAFINYLKSKLSLV